MSEWDMTLKEFLALLDEYNAGMMTMVARKEGKVTHAVVALDGEGTEEILDAIEQIYNQEGGAEMDDVSKEDVFLYLDDLRESGATNMFGAARWIENTFHVSRDDAKALLREWMQTFAERHPSDREGE